MPSTTTLNRQEDRRRALLPGSRRDTYIRIAKTAFPVAAGILLVILIALPLLVGQEFSFLLSKGSAMKSSERMRMDAASYRGETSNGETFLIRAESGVQKSSDIPIVLLSGLSARIDRADGLATVNAPSGEFFIDQNRVLVNGPVIVRSASGYSLDGDAINVDMNKNIVRSENPVSGTIPMGRFKADSFTGDVDGRRIVLEGRAHLSITPNRSPA